jgi:ATP-dependent 26S proteasome regulatory subunit
MDVLGNIIEEEENPIDLSFLLNLLDGTLESEGRILAITTNFPERIDRALIRPGRIDMIINFKKCSCEILRQMLENFYDKEVHYSEMMNEKMNKKWTPAEVNQILFRNFKDYEKALKELIELTPEELSGISN